MNDMFIMHNTIFNMIQECNNSIKLAESEIANYRDVYSTNDKFEACYNREWATVLEQMKDYKQSLEKLLTIENSRLEGEVKQLEECEIAVSECKEDLPF